MTITPQGLPAPIVGAMAENASLFLSYSELKDIIRWTNGQSSAHDLSLPRLALAGAGAGAITSFLLYVHYSIMVYC
jgi:ornithine carrier protein